MRLGLSSAALLWLALMVGCGAEDDASNESNLSSGGRSSSSGSSGELPSSGGSSSGAGSGQGSSSGDTAGTSSGGSSGTVPAFACPTGTTESVVRVVAGNISDGQPQNYDDGSGLRIFKGLAPDVALVQEMKLRASNDTDMQDFVTQGFGADYVFTRGSGDLPNGIVSRFPITSQGERLDPIVTNRTLVWARIDVPGDRDLVAISVHWHTTASRRPQQVEATLDLVDEIAGADDFVVLGGDFNTAGRAAEGIPRTSTKFVTTGPYPSDEQGNDNTNLPRSRPYDWVVADPALHERSRPFTLGSASFTNGLVFDSRKFTDLSLTPGVLATDSSTHQHMAVARSFVVACE